MIILIISFLAILSCASDKDMESEVTLENTIIPKEDKSTYSYLALGDSYTIGQSVDENQRFPVQLAKRLNEEGVNVGKPIIIERTGWTTDELARGIEDTNLSGTYDLVTLLIGVNNQYGGRDTAEYRRQFRELLNKAVGFARGIEKGLL